MKIATVVGARPQFIKAAVLSRVLKSIENVQEILIHTGQHYDDIMSKVFFEEMEIPTPDYHLEVKSTLHGDMTGLMLSKIESVLIKEEPDWVLVYGDTNSTLAGALAASKLHIPIAHVEAGLRSYNMKMPEEVNRILTDRLSQLLFVPSDTGRENLKKEGITEGVEVVGDIMYDAILYYKSKARKPDFPVSEKFLLLTLHRQESFENRDELRKFFVYLNELHKNTPIVFPCHPGTKKKLLETGIEIPTFAVNPVGYFEMLYLLEHCNLVMTDSGGLQKEAFYMNKLCLTLRDRTEWTELVDLGVNHIVGLNTELLDDVLKSRRDINFNVTSNPYGRGETGKVIANTLLRVNA